MNDMASTIIPKSDQLNADDLIAGPITVKITKVTIASGEQPISIHFEGDNGKPYKACKSMCRVMVTTWGADSKKYVGRSMTLYRDPTVKWAGMEVGGIRISHMSDIDNNITMALTATKGSRKPYTVKPLTATTTAASSSPSTSAESQAPDAGENDAATITADEAKALEARCSENGIDVAKLRTAAKVDRLSLILTADLPRAHQWIDAVIAKRKVAA
jgi:hypothetical protein